MPSADHDSAHRVHLRFRSTFESIERIVQEADRFANRHCGDEELAYRFVLVTSEAATNAVEHGNESDPARRVLIDFIACPTYLEMRVEDEGKGFDASAVDDPLAENHLTLDHGRGLFLIREMADDVHFEKEGRCLTARFDLEERSPPESSADAAGARPEDPS